MAANRRAMEKRYGPVGVSGLERGTSLELATCCLEGSRSAN